MKTACPRCGRKKTKCFWDVLLFCFQCNSSSLIEDPRYIITCPKCSEPLVPRVNYERPTLVCPECEREYKVPDKSVPEIVEESIG